METGKKSKKWLWIAVGIVAIVAVVGVVLGILLSGDTQEPEGPTGERPVLYWNVDRELYLDETGLSSRQPDADGKYHILFALDGKQVELTVQDKKLVNHIDSRDAVGLAFDENGMIVDVLNASDIATEIAYRFYVVKVEGNVLSLNSGLNMDGVAKDITCADSVSVYDFTGASEFKGQETDLSQFQPMDTVTVYGNDLGEVTHVGLMTTPVLSPVYWRTNMYEMYNWTVGTTTREPDENGVYSMEFFANGERVTLKCKDKEIVNQLDRTSGTACHTGFVFDEEGYIVATQASQLGIRGLLGCSVFDITEMDGKTFTAKCLQGSSNDIGRTYTNTYTEDTIIYNVSLEPMEEDRGKTVSDLQLGDRIVVFENTLGQPMQVFVSARVVPGPAYFNIDRKYDSANKTTTREPDANGWYYIDLYADGIKKTYKTKDKAQITVCDAQDNLCMGLLLDGDVIVRAYPSDCVASGGSRNNWLISDITGTLVTIQLPGGTIATTRLMAEDCKIYDMTGYTVPVGTETTLKQGDRATTLFNANGEIVCAFVRQRRVAGTDIYYNMDRKFDNDRQVSTREPDADGWYVYKMAKDGKVVYVKTKSAAMATKIDKIYFPILALEVNSSGVVQNAYPAAAATGGGSTYPYWTFDGYDGNGNIKVVPSDPNDDRTGTMSPAENMQIIHLAEADFKEYRGEHGTLKIGDSIMGLSDDQGKTVIVYIMSRDCYKPLCWRLDTMYDWDKKETTRVPDKDGWYTVQVAVDGEIRTYKTKDKDMMTSVDANVAGFSIYANEDGVILNVIGIMNVTGIDISGPSGYKVTKINGKKVTMEKDGDVKTLTMASDCKVMDHSSTAKQFGMYTELRVGDVVRTYQNSDELLTYVMTLSRYFPRVKGDTGYCEHCGKTVQWKEWIANYTNGQDGHYYLGEDCKISHLTFVNSDKKTDVVLDLNGKVITHEADQRVFLIQKGSSLSILDSVGGGKITGNGVTNGLGGMVLMSGGSSFNLYGGTVELTKENYAPIKGGIIYAVGSSVNIYGGKMVCPTLPDGTGSVYLDASEITIAGGTVSGGEISVRSGSTVTLSGRIKVDCINLVRGVLIACKDLNTKSSVGILANGKFTEEIKNAGAYLSVFKPADQDTVILVQDNTLLCRPVLPDFEEVCEEANKMDFSNPKKLPDYCPACGLKSGVKWVALTNNTEVALEGHYYVPAGGLTLTEGGFNVGSSYTASNACVHLNGSSITGTDSAAVFSLRTKLNLMGDGTVVCGDTRTIGTNGCTVNIYGGTYSTTRSDGRVIWSHGAGTVNLYAGAVDGSAGRFGIYLNNGATLNMAGGSVTGQIYSDNNATTQVNTIIISGGTVHNTIGMTTCDMAVTGGTIAELRVNKDATVRLSGKPVISKLYFGENAKVIVETLEQGASIAVSANGVFTRDFATAAAAEGARKFFHAAEETSKEIKLDGMALSCVLKPGAQEPDPGPGTDPGTGTEPDPDPGVTVVPGEVCAAAQQMDFSDPNNLPTNCPACGLSSGVTWVALTSDTATALEGHYYVPAGGLTLTEGGFTVGSSYTAPGACVHLNGSSITGTDSAAVFSLRRTLNLMGDGTVVCGDTRTIGTNGCTVNIYGGTYSTTRSNGRVIWSHGAGTINLYAGTVNGSAGRFGIYLNNGATLNMAGGSVIAQIYSDNNDTTEVNTIHISGGTVHNTIGMTTCDMTVTGGTIAELRGNENATIRISGKPVISKLYLAENAKVIVGTLEQGANIAVSANGVFTENFENEAAMNAAKAFIRPADTGKEIKAEGLALACVEETAAPELSIYEQAKLMNFSDTSNLPTNCPACGLSSGVTWVALTSDTATALDGHYYVPAEGITLTEGGFTVGSSYTAPGACIHLNSSAITGTDSAAVFALRTKLNLMGDGTVVCGDTRTIGTNSGTVNIYGGTYSTTRSNGRVIWSHGAGTVNLHAGTVDGSAGRFGIYLNNGATLNMAGGSVIAQIYSDNNDTTQVNTIHISGGTVHNTIGMTTCDMTVTGGTLAELRVNKDATVRLSGKPVISKLYFGENAKVIVGTLEQGASIAVSANGVFTENFENEAAVNLAKAFIRPADTGKEIKAEGLALACVDKSAAPELSVYEQAKLMNFSDTSNLPTNCPACGLTTGVVWEELPTAQGTSAVSLSGHYYLKTTNTENVNPLVLSGKTCIHLNNNTLAEASGDRVIYAVGQELNIMGDGTVGAATATPRALDVGEDATVNLYGGIFTSANSWPVFGFGNGTVKVYEGATVEKKIFLRTALNVEIHGGTVGSIGSEYSGCTSTVKITGGTLTGYIDMQHGVSLEITGGTVNKIAVAASYPGTVTISGNPVISALELASGKLIAVGEMTENASVTVKATGVFTENFANQTAADAALQYFHPVSGKAITRKELALSSDAA